MRIAIEATTWVNPRGYGRFTRELTLALLRAASGHTFTLLVDSEAAKATDLPAAPTVVVPTRRTVRGAEGARSISDMLRMTVRLSGFDAILFPTNYSFVPVLPGPLVAVVIHDAMPETMSELLASKRARLFWNLKNRLVRYRADLLATVSQASADEISRNLRLDPGRLLVLTEGASPVFTPHATTSDDKHVRDTIGEPGRFVLYVGGLSPHKRVAELIRAFGKIAGESRHAGLRLVLTGPEDKDTFTADRSGVSQALRSIGPAASRVVRTGFVPDATLAALYRGAVCVVLPSRMEGFGLPALEAMASGAPLIVTRNAALEEVCGGAAEYVDQIDELAGVLDRFLGDPARRAELRLAGLQRASLFSWDEAANRLLQRLSPGPIASVR